MAKRVVIGLIFRNYSNWTGGVYYMVNLIQALKSLPDDEKPSLVIAYYDEEGLALLKKIDYPFVQYKHVAFHLPEFKKGINRISNLLTGKKIYDPAYFSTDTAGIFFPNPVDKVFDKIEHKLYWIPDFQEKYLPHFFSEQELAERNAWQHELADNNRPIVFSSRDALSDFRKFFPASQSQTFVLPFAVSHQESVTQSENEILDVYGLKKTFFIAPNQFWQHKNHKIIVEAVELLQSSYREIQVVFTGKEDDYRSAAYPTEIRNLISQKGLDEQVKMIGFIDRAHLFVLLKKSIAVIQPSFFEGWSTVVEDAKARNKIIIASDIAVHKEQLGDSGIYFSPTNAKDLAVKMTEVLEGRFAEPDYHYNDHVTDFARAFVGIINKSLS